MARPPDRLVLDIQIRTIVKIASALALLWCLWKLSSLILLLSVAVILAVALDVPVSWLAKRGPSRTTAALMVSFALFITVAAFVWLTWSSLLSQWEYLTVQLNRTINTAAQYVPSWIALPIAALYPTIERIWLREQLPPETVIEHRALTRSSAPG